MDVKKIIRERIIIGCLMLAIVLVLGASVTIAWFANNASKELNTIKMVSVGDLFTIEPLGNPAVSGIYDDASNASSYVRNKLMSEAEKTADIITWTIIADTLANDGTTVLNGKNIGNGPAQGHEGGISPGSSGELQFIVRPGNDVDSVDVTYDMYLYAYTGGYDDKGDEDKTRIEIIDLESQSEAIIARKLLNGHILFFETYENGKYGGLISSNSDFERIFTKTYTQATTEKVYWVWPETLAELVLDDAVASHRVNLRGKSSLCDANTRKQVIKFFNAHTNWFLLNPLNVNESWASVFSGSTDNDVTNTVTAINGNYALYSSYYNEADQCIGTYVSYLMLDMTAAGAVTPAAEEP